MDPVKIVIRYSRTRLVLSMSGILITKDGNLRNGFPESLFDLLKISFRSSYVGNCIDHATY
jgi:hypothetical protein